jgi:Flp pilus assembly protein TadG
MNVFMRFRDRGRDDRGATIVIVALALVAMFGMIVLVVDVGGLLWKRRELVNGSDAAALSAAETCALKSAVDPRTAEQAADEQASQNVTGLDPTTSTNVTVAAGTCHTTSAGWVKAAYSQQQHLFFAPVLGFSNQSGVSTKAYAIWGPTGAANPIPIVVYANAFNNCKLDIDPTAGPNCFIWEDNNNTQANQSGFGLLDLRTDDPSTYGWDSVPGAACPNPGSDVKTWIDTYPNPDFGELPTNYPAATYVCRVNGMLQSGWASLSNLKGKTLYFPLNRCDPASPATFGQLDSGGTQTSCPNTPNQYDIIGFVALELIEVYDPKDPAVTGSSGTCSQPLAVPQTAPFPSVNLSTFGAANGCYTSAPDAFSNISLTKVKNQDPGSDPVLNQDYTVNTSDPKNPILTWLPGGPANEKQTYTLSFDWQKGGACGIPPSGNNSGHCLIIKVTDVQIGGSGPNNGSPDSNLRAVKLCDPAIAGSCNGISVQP